MINILNRESGELIFMKISIPNLINQVVNLELSSRIIKALKPKMKIFDTLKEPLWLSGETNNQSIQKRF